MSYGTHPNPAIASVADVLDDSIYRMHGLSSSCNHAVEAAEVLAFIRETVHGDGPDREALRAELGL